MLINSLSKNNSYSTVQAVRNILNANNLCILVNKTSFALHFGMAKNAFYCFLQTDMVLYAHSESRVILM